MNEYQSEHIKMKGGKREGAGRKPGSKSKRTVAFEKKVAETAAKLESMLAQPFKGDAHTLLMAIYKDLEQPLILRLDAAKAAIGYERPRLQSVQHSGEMTHTLKQEDALKEIEAAINGAPRAGANGHDVDAH